MTSVLLRDTQRRQTEENAKIHGGGKVIREARLDLCSHNSKNFDRHQKLKSLKKKMDSSLQPSEGVWFY